MSLHRNAVRRVAKDLEQLTQEPIVGCSAAPGSDADISLWHANIRLQLSHGGTDYSCILHFLIHFQPDYPQTAPHVGFCTHFPWRQGATKEGSGMLISTMEICLNILGNFDFVHDEWAGIQGEGWSAGMSVSSLLVQLQSVLTALDSDLSQKEKKELQKACNGFSIKVDGTTAHTGLKPWPPLDAPKPQKQVAKVIKDQRKCYFTLNTAEDDVLGFGARLDGKMVKTDGEIISWEAYSTHGVRLSAYKKPFTHFIPCFINPAHAGQKAWNDILSRTLEKFQTVTGDEYSIEVLLRLMNSLTVEIMKGEKVCAVSFFEAYCSFWRSVRSILDAEPKTRDFFQNKLTRFATKENRRLKEVCPDVGMLLAMYTVMPEAVPRDDFVGAYLDESVVRQVLWWMKDGIPIKGALTFKASHVSRGILLFNLRVLDTIVPGGDAAKASAAMDESAGTVPGRLDQLLDLTKTSPNPVNGLWHEFFAQAGAPQSMIDAAAIGGGDEYVNSLRRRAEQRGQAYVWNPKGSGKGKGSKGKGSKYGRY